MDSPCWLVTDDAALGAAVAARVEALCADLAASHGAASGCCVDAWARFGEVAVVASREEMAALADLYAPEHLQVT